MIQSITLYFNRLKTEKDPANEKLKLIKHEHLHCNYN